MIGEKALLASTNFTYISFEKLILQYLTNLF